MLTKKSQYAFKALTFLAKQPHASPCLIAQIAKSTKVPIKFLENILLELKKEKIVQSKKGKGGGYYLAVKPEKLKVATIMRLTNGPIAMLPCVSLYFYEKCTDCNQKKCGLHNLMVTVRDKTLSVLEKKTIKDLIK